MKDEIKREKYACAITHILFFFLSLSSLCLARGSAYKTKASNEFRVCVFFFFSSFFFSECECYDEWARARSRDARYYDRLRTQRPSVKLKNIPSALCCRYCRRHRHNGRHRFLFSSFHSFFYFYCSIRGWCCCCHFLLLHLLLLRLCHRAVFSSFLLRLHFCLFLMLFTVGRRPLKEIYRKQKPNRTETKRNFENKTSSWNERATN